MEYVQKGDKVQVHYTGSLDNGEVFDSSKGRDPLEFNAGHGHVIKGFDDAVLGMVVGEKKKVHIPAADAYGDANKDLIVEIPRADFPADMKVEVGMQLQMRDEGGHMFPVTVTKLGKESITVDANHSLAGKDLTFAIELVGIKTA